MKPSKSPLYPTMGTLRSCWEPWERRPSGHGHLVGVSEHRVAVGVDHHVPDHIRAEVQPGGRLLARQRLVHAGGVPEHGNRVVRPLGVEMHEHAPAQVRVVHHVPALMIGTGLDSMPWAARTAFRSTILLLAFIPWSADSSTVASGWSDTRRPMASSRMVMCRMASGWSGAFMCIA